MSRFVEYFVTAGIEKDEYSQMQPGQQCNPKILYRLPLEEWSDFPLPSGLAEFCQPDCWVVKSQFCRPIFCSNVLTNMGGYQAFCSCLLFFENFNNKTNIFIPKAFIIVSKYNYYLRFKEILACIFESMLSHRSTLNNTESIISKILFNSSNAKPESPKFILSLADNRFVICPPLSSTIPVTDDFVSILLQNVGIYNLMRLFCALLLDFKIVFISKSCTYLYKCTLGLVSLIYPFKYYYTLIPILPERLIEVLHSLTPFIIGTHSLCNINMADMNDVMFMNLDIGQLMVHDGLQLPNIPEPYNSDVIKHLVSISRPDLETVDQVYPNTISQNIRLLDKKIRACFFYLLLKLLSGYRPCVTYTRLLPCPVMKFHVSLFLQNRNITKNEFYVSFFDTTSFNTFVNNRGPTMRECDYFDDIINQFDYVDNESQEEQLRMIYQISDEFLRNEPSCNPCNYSDYDIDLVDISDNHFISMSVSDINTSLVIPPKHYRTVAEPSISCKNSKVPLNLLLFQHNMIYYIGHRRVEMIQECVSLIFGNKYSEALKLMHPVIQSLSSKACRMAVINELMKYKNKDRTVLPTSQFSLVITILNNILNLDKTETCYGAAAMVIPLIFNFCQLVGDVHQYAFVCVQNHSVWNELSFWVNYYFYETQLYLLSIYNKSLTVTSDTSDVSLFEVTESVLHPQLINTISALDATAQLTRVFETLDDQRKLEYEKTEISFLQSQTIDILYKLCNMLVNYESVKSLMDKHMRRDSSHCELFKSAKLEKIKEIEKYMANFLNVVNRYISFKADMLNSLQQLIIGTIEARFDEVVLLCQQLQRNENSEAKYTFKLNMLYEKELELYRALGHVFFLYHPGEYDYDPLGSLSLIPAKGDLIITTKRLVFVGRPVELFLSDFQVNISIPSHLIIKFKLIDANKCEIKGIGVVSKAILIKTKIAFAVNFSPVSHFDACFDQIKKNVKLALNETEKQNKSPKTKQEVYSTASQGNKLSSQRNRDSMISKVSHMTVASSASNLPSPDVQGKGTLKKKSWFKHVENFTGFKKRVSTKEQMKQKSCSFNIPVDKDVIENYCLGYDYIRMGFFPSSNISKPIWRITNINKSHCITHNIPDYIIMPLFTNDDNILPLFKQFRHKRIPICTFIYGNESSSTQNKTNKSFCIIRSEPPQRVVSSTKLVITHNKTGNEIVTFLSTIAMSLNVSRKHFFANNKMLERITNYVSVKSPNQISSWELPSMFVFYDRTYSRNTNIDKTSFIPIETLNSHNIKKSYEFFIKSFLPLSPREKNKKTPLEIVQDSYWPTYVTRALMIASFSAFVGDVFSSSSYFALSDGVDMTSVLCCLSQILVDPFYRTFLGFQKLIEKDWLEMNYNYFGKNFIDFSPIFIFFLDCVYQLTCQFPCAFEFNTYFLSFIAFHNFSTKFDTFMVGDETVEVLHEDNPDQSMPVDDISDKVSLTLSTAPSAVGSPSYNRCSSSNCIFRFMQTYIDSTVVFHNLLYDPCPVEVLYPSSLISSFETWPLYYALNLQFECMYNLETLNSNVLSVFQSQIHTECKRDSSEDVFTANEYKPDIRPTTYTYTGDGSPHVLSSIGNILYEISKLNDELDNFPTVDNSYINPTPISPPASYLPITSPLRLVEFTHNRANYYRLAAIPRNLRLDPDKSEGVHFFLKLETFYSANCNVCCRPISWAWEACFCSKCSLAFHNVCQNVTTMTCSSRSAYNSQSPSYNEDQAGVIQEPFSESNFQFQDDDNSIQGVLLVKKKHSNNYSRRFCCFSKKSHNFTIYPTSSNTGIPSHSYHVSELSNCRQVQLNPTLLPKGIPENCGCFEIKINKKLESLISVSIPESTKWVLAFNKCLDS